jgi:general secretion pathway protein F
MPDFNIQLFDRASQRIVSEVVSAKNSEAARTLVESRGRVLQCSVLKMPPAPQSSAETRSTARLRAAEGRLDVSWWCRELNTLLRAGMTVVEALATMRVQARGEGRKRLHDDLLVHLQSGQSLSTAMAAVAVFPGILVSSVKASERTSTLTHALEDYLRYHELLAGLKKKVISASIYPALVATLGACISLFLLLFVLPRFAGMYTSGAGATGMTAVLLLLSSWIRGHTQHVALFSCLGAGAALWAWRSGYVTRVIAYLIERTPALQARIDQFRLAKLYQALALMVKGGYALPEALHLAAGLDLGRDFGERLLMAEQELKEGRSVSTVLAKAQLTDEVTQRLVQVGERTGSFDTILSTLAQRHGDNFTLFVERTTRIVEPLLLLTVSLIVGSLVVLMYLPVFDIANSIQ